jgi:hypothetical protein
MKRRYWLPTILIASLALIGINAVTASALWQQHPLLSVGLLVLGFPEVVVIDFAAILVVQFGDQIEMFINTALNGNNPWQS